MSVGQFEEVQDGDGRGEQSGRDIRAESRLVQREPLDARAEQAADQRGDEQNRRGDGHREEGRTEGEAAQRVEVVGQRPYGGALQRRRRKQRGGRALLGDRPETLGDAEDEDRAEKDRERAAGGRVEPQRRDHEEREAQYVRDDHRPTAVQGAAVLGGLGGLGGLDRRGKLLGSLRARRPLAVRGGPGTADRRGATRLGRVTHRPGSACGLRRTRGLPGPCGSRGPRSTRARRDQRRQRAQEHGSEEQRRENPGAEHGGDGKCHAPVSGTEGALGDRRLQRQQQKHENGEYVADTADELGTPQPPQRR